MIELPAPPARFRLGWLALLASIAGCGGPAVPPAPPADAVAVWDGGAVTLAELESAFAEARLPVCRRARRGGGIDELLPCYRRLAEGLALERLVLSGVEDVEAALTGLDDYELLRRRALVDAWLRDVRADLEIGDADVAARFDADPERYRRPGTVDLADIFRRHRDPARPGDTLAFLGKLKERFEAGESFAALAREHSHSETRSRGGEVGRVTAADLPARLSRVVFSLAEGEVSDPVRVRGGAVLLHVRSSTPPVEPTLADAERQIRRELALDRIDEAIAARVAGREPPPGSLVLEHGELVAALDAGDPGRTVLDIGGDRLSAGELRRLAGLGTRGAAELDGAGRERLAAHYLRQRQRRLLALELIESADPELRRLAAEQLRRQALPRLVDDRLRHEMEGLIDEEALRAYFADNRHHYQSPLRFELRAWDLPFGDDPPSQLRRMETLHRLLAAGEIDLAEAASELGGTVTDLGWRELDALPEGIPNKARTYLLELGAGGFSVPYQQDDALHVLELVERQEPRPREYEEVAEQVRADYLTRFQQELYRRIADERLGAAGFVFDGEAVRRLLAPPTS